MGYDGVTVKTSVQAYFRYVLGKSLDSDCDLWNGGRCGEYDPNEPGGYHLCVGLKKCKYYTGKETGNK